MDGRRRVELNAFTSDQFVEWLEDKLQELQYQGIIKKVVPDTEILERVYRANVAGSYFKERTEDIAREAWKQTESATIPDELIQDIQERLADDSTVSWWEAIKDIVSPEAEVAEKEAGAG